MPLSTSTIERLVRGVQVHRSALRKQAAILAVVFGLVGGLLSGFGDTELARAGWLCVFAALMSGLLALGLLLADPRGQRGIRKLAEPRQDAVWIYIARGSGTNAMMSWLMVRFEDGATARVPIPFGEESELLECVRGELPSATVGYTPATDRAFRANPASLRQ